ncbi:MAG TPA: sugar ABC transporter substrate-binding protein [Ktedonobacteraceae bacterium]|nr:sugar ABC transporter substrate-binding protein [Ktedonobacteraceae bacterium]
MKLFSKTRASFTLFSGLLLLTMILTSCGSANSGSSSSTPTTSSSSGSTPTSASGAATNGKGCTKIGVLLPETATSARWDAQDRPFLIADIQAAIPGATVDYSNAQGDSATQQNQADQALTKGDCILVVAPVDSAASAVIVTKAKASNVPVIAYDRIIQSKSLSYYVSFDGEQVGKLQGQYIVNHYKDFTKSSKNVVLINGSKTDQNAINFNKGVEETLAPLFTNGSLKKVYDQFTPKWDNPTAQTEMEGALTANNNNVAIAYVANDGMASTVIAALRAQHLNGKVLVTGQDATVAGFQNILKGDQAMTIYKPINQEAQATADIVKALNAGTTPTNLTSQSATTDGGSIPSLLLAPIAVDKSNINQTVIKDGFVKKAAICAGIPAGTDGVC